MPIRRVAIVFDNRARPETTGVYCRRALGSLVEVEHFLPAELGRLPRQGFDLYLRIDDGLEARWPADLRPCAWWAIDTHLNFDWCRRHAADFDLVFAAQSDGAAGLRQVGIASAAWLPLACDPDFHRPHEVALEFDACFVGNLFPGERADLIALLQHRFPRMFVGQRYFEEMARTYSASRLVFNRSIRNDVNMRVFEALGCGALLLTNDLRDNGQEVLFRDGIHLATYRSAEELLDKAQFYLHQEEVRTRVAGAGRAEVLARHTYRHRMEQILQEANKQLARTSLPVAPPRQAQVPSTRPEHEGSLSAASLGQSAQPVSLGRDPAYFQFARPELLALVPPSARDILDVGCGAGMLGRALKKRQQARVVGVECNPEAAALARQCLDEVLFANAESADLSFAPGRFDVVVCGDVLEHLRDPGGFLHRAVAWLRPGGCLVASIPNVRHHSVVRGLLGGHWTYESAGLLDNDHVRFFTRREIEKLLFRSGFEIRLVQVVPGPGHADWVRAGRPGEVQIDGLDIRGLPPEEAEEFYAYQYLIQAEPRPPSPWGLTSIVLVTFNQVAYTQLCLDSLRLFTDEPYEVIVVDNASTDGTVEYLRTLSGLRLVMNNQNRGFPVAANQGIQVARGDQVLLLNNDTLATTGWLARQLRTLHSDLRIGLVGPCSNRVSGEQLVPVRYGEDMAGLDGFAWDWSKAHDRQTQDTDRLVGFCLLIRRALIDRIGLLDERFGIGCFEDDDYCLRAIQAGFRVVIARDAFIHHFGGRTFIGSGADFAGIMRENEQRFREKWTNPQPSPEPVQPRETQAAVEDKPASALGYTIQPGEGRGLLLARSGVELSLCMIVRDNARTIRPCLESIRPWVDEMVVVDTGSKDETPRIAEELGAQVFHFPWCDSFSIARNESLRHARGRWLFWMDSDDIIPPECGRRLRDLIRQAVDPKVLGFVMQVHCPGPGNSNEAEITVVDHVKLFRNRPDLRFDGRIHEQILPAIREAGGAVDFTDVYVVHSGYDHSPQGQKHKLERDLRLLHLEAAERPEHPFTLFNLGMTYTDVGQCAEALGYLNRCLKVSDPGASHLRKAYAFLVSCHDRLGQTAEADRVCAEGLRMFPRDAELRFRRGLLLHGRGELHEAVRTYVDLLANPEDAHFKSVVEGVTGHMARHNLALVYSDLGNEQKAEEQWRRVVEERPRYRPGWHGLGELLVRRGRLDEALALAEQLQAGAALRPEAALLRSLIAMARGDRVSARQELEQALTKYPGDLDLVQTLCRLLFEQRAMTEAERWLRELTRLAPADASAHHNLGSACLHSSRLQAAVAALRESVRLRPQAPATWLLLGHALQQAGQPHQATDAWREVLRIDPNNAEAKRLLEKVKEPR